MTGAELIGKLLQANPRVDIEIKGTIIPGTPDMEFDLEDVFLGPGDCAVIVIRRAKDFSGETPQPLPSKETSIKHPENCECGHCGPEGRTVNVLTIGL